MHGNGINAAIAALAESINDTLLAGHSTAELRREMSALEQRQRREAAAGERARRAEAEAAEQAEKPCPTWPST